MQKILGTYLARETPGSSFERAKHLLSITCNLKLEAQHPCHSLPQWVTTDAKQNICACL